jgi:hypothetical protein
MCAKHGACPSWRFLLVHLDDDVETHFEWYWMDDNVGVNLAISVTATAVRLASDDFSSEMGLPRPTYLIN